MNSPKFENGDIVYADPCGGDRGMSGKVIGVIHYIDGTFSYMVSMVSFGGEAVSRHILHEHELVKKSDIEKAK
jgi:hypothetical protein